MMDMLHLLGRGSVVYAPIKMAKSTLKAMIPSHVLDLVQIDGLDVDTHVVLIALAKQTIDFGANVKVSYQEIFPIIPNVGFAGDISILFQVVPVLWVSNVVIASGARTHWKMNKLYAKFSELDMFPIDTANGVNRVSNSVTTSLINFEGTFAERVVIKADLESTGDSRQRAKDHAPFKQYMRFFAAPMLYWQGHDFVTASFNINVDNAMIEGAQGRLCTGGLHGMAEADYTLRPLDANNPFGAFWLGFDWTLTPCSPYPPMPPMPSM